MKGTRLFLSGFIGLLASSMVLAACGQAAPAAPTAAPAKAATTAAPAAAAKTIRLGHIAPADDPFNVAATKFAELVAAKTSGQVTVQVFPGGQLGNDREQIEGMKLGTIDMSIEGSINYEAFVPETALFDLPFIYADRAAAFKALDSPTSQQLWDLVRTQVGVRILSLPENGFRQITTAKKAVNSLADLKGLKMRVPQTKLYLDTFKALGTNPTPITFTELFTSLQGGVVDGQENALGLTYSSKFYEVQKYLAISNHIYDAAPLAMSEKTYQSLTPAQQKAVQEAAVEARDFQRKFVLTRDDDLLTKLKTAGMTVTTPARADFVTAVQPVINEYKQRFGADKIDKILAGN